MIHEGLGATAAAVQDLRYDVNLIQPLGAPAFSWLKPHRNTSNKAEPGKV